MMTLSIQGQEGQAETLDSFQETRACEALSSERTFTIGSINDRAIQLTLRPDGKTDSIATINAMSRVLLAIQELQQARAERQERVPLWPADDLNVSRDGAVISGRMRELMTFAQRVARTTVNVLITGESGTGKEILARAIHNFSDRAQKPFVPVNCAAVPRELLESHLFGHRRGAFTGADRDHAGFIRAARDGTLFLDEVAELGLDLQPKLLRFLESGEIAPLGEPTPLTVNVRIVAATNTKPRADSSATAGFAKTSSTASTSSPSRFRRCASAATKSPAWSSTSSRRAAEEFHKGHLDRSRRNHGAPPALSMARQRPPAPQRAAPHRRPR